MPPLQESDSSPSEDAVTFVANGKLLSELRELFRFVEETESRLERGTQECFVPAVNQLRYAGAHLLKALDPVLNGSDSRVDEKKLGEAIGHGKRAYYDASEALLLFRLKETKAIRDRVGDYSFILKDYIKTGKRITKDYPELLEGLLDAERYVEDHPASKLSSESREENYDKLEPHVQAVSAYNEAFNIFRDDIFKDIAKRRAKEEQEQQDRLQNQRNWQITIFISVVGILLSVILTLLLR